MMTRQLANYVIPHAYALLPTVMASDAATAMLMAIALQESKCVHRRQVRGPARSFWQFEVAGVVGLLRHEASSAHLRSVIERLAYKRSLTASEIHATIEHNDVLACCCARLLLWTLPEPLPDRDDVSEGWRQYLAAWRPGTPRPSTWAENFDLGWTLASTVSIIWGRHDGLSS